VKSRLRLTVCQERWPGSRLPWGRCARCMRMLIAQSSGRAATAHVPGKQPGPLPGEWVGRQRHGHVPSTVRPSSLLTDMAQVQCMPSALGTGIGTEATTVPFASLVSRITGSSIIHDLFMPKLLLGKVQQHSLQHGHLPWWLLAHMFEPVPNHGTITR
jgi:hypothetical protein